MNHKTPSTPGSSERLEFSQVRTVFLCALVALIDGFDIQAMAVVTPRLIADWHLQPGTFAPVLSASFAGIMLGSILLGQSGDRFGRRAVILFAFATVGLASIATAMARSVEAMMLLRFITGFAIGGCLPNVTALTAEALPTRFIGRAVTAMYCFVPLGGALGGVVGSLLIAHYDWQAVFLVGGTIPLFMLLALWRWLAEPPRRTAAPERGSQLQTALRQAGRFGVLRSLFQPPLRYVSSTLWLTFFCSMAGTYLLSSWLPTLFNATGSSLHDAIQMMSLFQLGGVIGGVSLGWLIDKKHLSWLPSSFLLGALMSVFMAYSTAQYPYLPVVVVLAGVGIIGSQLSLNALCARLYPQSLRSSGIGWALGVGRAGAIASPYLGGLALDSSSAWQSVFVITAALMLLCSLSCTLLTPSSLASATGAGRAKAKPDSRSN